MTLRCVPVEPTEGILTEFITGHSRRSLADHYMAMLAAAPPPPKEIAEALELAERHMRLSEDPPADCKICTLSRALLQSWGRE